MQAVFDDLLWQLRYGDAYGQGVAAAALSFYTAPADRMWVATVGAVPLVALLSSPEPYARHCAAR